MIICRAKPTLRHGKYRFPRSLAMRRESPRHRHASKSSSQFSRYCFTAAINWSATAPSMTR